MARLLFCFICGILVSSCSPVIYETVVDPDTGTVWLGYSDAAQYPFNKGLKQRSIGKDTLSVLESRGLGFLFEYQETDTLYALKIVKPGFSTSRGIKVGDSIDDAIRVYGKPRKKKKIFMDFRPGGELLYLNDVIAYENLEFYYLSKEPGKPIVVISVGRNFVKMR